MPSIRLNVSSASRQAVAAFSILTGRPIFFSITLFMSKSGQCRFGANTRRWVPGSTRPGRLMPMPSIVLCCKAFCIRAMQSVISSVDAAGSVVRFTCDRESNRPFRSTVAIVASFGWTSTAITTRSSFNSRRVDGRPRGGESTAPSQTHFSPISCSTICDTVLLCSPD